MPLILTLLAALVTARQDIPDELRALEASRAGLATGEVHWTIQCGRPGERFAEPQHFVSRFAGETHIVEDRRDAKAGIRRDEDETGAPQERALKQPRYTLYYQGDQWTHRERSRVAHVRKDTRDFIDARCFGLGDVLGQGMDVRTFLRNRSACPDCEFEVSWTDDGLCTVTTRSEAHDRTIVRLLDPKKGWNAVHVESYQGEEKVREARIDLARFGDHWFPASVDLFSAEFQDGRKPLYSIKVREASFNDPGHDRHLGPADIGVEVGTNVYVGDSYNRLQGVFGWDNEKLVPLDDLFKRIRSGELEEGLVFQEEVRRSAAEGRRLGTYLGEWERYTLQFIRRFKLNEAQRQSALAILKDCKERASQYLRARRSEIEEVRAAVQEVYKGESSPDKRHKRLEELAPLERRMWRLQAPILKIFHRSLVPRLNRIPTAAQKKQAEAEG